MTPTQIVRILQAIAGAGLIFVAIARPHFMTRFKFVGNHQVDRYLMLLAGVLLLILGVWGKLPTLS